MALDNDAKSVTRTLSGTDFDTVTLGQAWSAFDITNHDSTDVLYFRQDGIDAVAQAKGCSVLLPGQSKVVAAIVQNGTIKISVVGDGGTYTIEGVN